jgi:hypothetical protein
MPFLSEQTLQGLRDGVVRRLLFTTPYQLQQLTPNSPKDWKGNPTAGGSPNDWRVIESDYCGVVQSNVRPQEEVIFARLGTVVPYTLKMPIYSAVEPTHRIQLPDMLLDVVGVSRNPSLPLWLVVTADEVK